MGIKNLTKFIKEKCQDAYVTENINALSFKKNSYRYTYAYV